MKRCGLKKEAEIRIRKIGVMNIIISKKSTTVASTAKKCDEEVIGN